MGSLAAKTGYGGANQLDVYTITGNAFLTTALFTFDRNMSESPTGIFAKKNYKLAVNSAIRNEILKTVLETTASDEEPTKVKDVYTNSDYTSKIVVGSSTIVLGGIFYYSEDADSKRQVDVFRFVWTGNTGDIEIAANESNKVNLECTGVDDAATCSVPSACFDTILVSGATTLSIPADEMGTYAFLTTP